MKKEWRLPTKEELKQKYVATHIPQIGENFWFAYATWLEDEVIELSKLLIEASKSNKRE